MSLIENVNKFRELLNSLMILDEKYVEGVCLLNNNFNHVYKKLEVMFNSVECDNYINSLLYNDRDGIRQGFPKEVFAVLYKIKESNSKLCGFKELTCVFEHISKRG